MAKKRKNKLNKFNHNTDKNDQKNLKKEKNLDLIKKEFATIKTSADKKSNTVHKTIHIFQTFTQKISLFALKQKAWIKTRTKTIDAALKSQLIPIIKTVAKVIDAKINILKNFKQNGITSTLDSISELNKDRFEISFIQPVSQSSPKVIDSSKIFTNAKIISGIKYSARPCCPLPKLMSLNVKPTARLEKILNDLLQKLFEENARKSKYIFDSFSTNDLFTESPTSIWSTTNNSTQLQQNLHSLTMAYKNSSFSSNDDDDENQMFKIVKVTYVPYEEHQFETNNESYEYFTTDPYSMTDLINKESSTSSFDF
jgi:hypothetical protein